MEMLGRALEHTAFTTSENINKAIDAKGYRKTSDSMLLNYSTEGITYPDASIANKNSVNFSDYQTTNFTYNNETKTYDRSMNVTGTTNDLVTKEVNTTKNIIVYGIHMEYREYGYNYMTNIGLREGYYLSEGKSTPISWSKASRDSKTVYKTKDNKELFVNDGNTYLLIYPSNMGSLSIN